MIVIHVYIFFMIPTAAKLAEFKGPQRAVLGGPLQGRYNLDSFHLHWGKSLHNGGEHTIQGHHFAAEASTHDFCFNLCVFIYRIDK